MLMLATAMLIFPLMDAICKALQPALQVPQIIWGRNIVLLAIILPFILWRYRREALNPSQPWGQVIRAALMAGSSILFTVAIGVAPLADTLAVFFIHPFIATALSPYVLRERVTVVQWIAIVTGLTGALVVIGPGFADVSPGLLLAIVAGFSFAAAMLLTRRLAGGDPPLVTMLITGLVQASLCGGMLPFVWVTPTLQEWLLILAAGIIGVIGFALLTFAYEYATASRLAPMGYLEIVGAIIAGMLMFGDFPSPAVWIGIGLIVTSGIVIAVQAGQRPSRQRRRR